MKRSRLIWTLPLFVLCIAIAPIRQLIAQVDCPAIVQQALLAMNNNCDAMDRNTVCYGYTLVNASFTQAVDDSFFTIPADRAPVRQLATVTTAGMDVDANLWGVAVLNVQANVPNTVPGQSARFILLGDAEIEDAVDPADAFTPVDPLTVIATERINVRSAPSLTANVIDVTSAGENLPADGLDASAAWLRVARGGFVGWVARSVIQSADDLDDLPTITAQTRQPMQSFYLRTGIGQPACEEAPPDSIMVQGPDNIVIDLTINGAEFQLASTMLVRIIDPGDVMEVISIAGEVTVDGVTLTAGQRTRLCLDEPDNLGVDGESNDRVVICPPSEPENLSTEEQSGLCALAQIQDNVLNYIVPIDCDDGFFERDIATRPVRRAPDTPAPTSAAFDCFDMRPVSPSGQISGVGSTFTWNPLPATIPVTGYRVRVAQAGATVAEVEVAPTATSVQIGGLPPNTPLTWRVEGVRDGAIVCYSVPVSFTTGSTPPPVVPPPADPPPADPPPVDPPPPPDDDDDDDDDDPDLSAFIPDWVCGANPGEVSFVWSDLPAGQTMFVFFGDTEGVFHDFDSTDESGTFVFTGVSFPTSEGNVALSPSGQTFTLPELDCIFSMLSVSATCGETYQLDVVWSGADPSATIEILVNKAPAEPTQIFTSGESGIETVFVGGNLVTTISIDDGIGADSVTLDVRCKPPVEITNIECVEGFVSVSYINSLPNEPTVVFFSYDPVPPSFDPILIPIDVIAEADGSGTLNSSLTDAQNVSVIVGSTGESTPTTTFDPILDCS